MTSQLPIENWHDYVGDPTLSPTRSSTAYCTMPTEFIMVYIAPTPLLAS